MTNELTPAWDGYFWSQPISIPIQDGVVLLRIVTNGSEDPPTARQIEVASGVGDYLVGLNDYLDDFAEAACRDMDDHVDLAAEGIAIDYHHIRRHYKVRSVVIGALEGCSDDYFFLTCDCDWDEEHGIQFMLAGREVLHCGDHTGAAMVAETDQDYRDFCNRELG